MPTDRTFWLIASLILIVSAAVGFWLVPEWSHYYQTSEQRFEYLTESIWCPICEGETIATSQVEVSRELRSTIREMVNEGKTNEQIYNYIEDNYGSSQVAIPRTDWIQRLSTGLPFMLIGGILVLVLGFAWVWSDKSSGSLVESDGTDKVTTKKKEKIEEQASKGGPLH